MSKEDAQQVIKHVLPGLKELGYSFKTEGKKDAYWDTDHETSSVSSMSTTRSWSSVGSRKPNTGDQVVFVDLPEFLPPKQLWELVQQALQSKSIDTKDCSVSFTKLMDGWMNGAWEAYASRTGCWWLQAHRK